MLLPRVGHPVLVTTDIISGNAWAYVLMLCVGSMGPKNDSNAVVDTQGRVYGVQGSRIVDASTFPLLPPGHPQATVCESFR